MTKAPTYSVELRVPGTSGALPTMSVWQVLDAETLGSKEPHLGCDFVTNSHIGERGKKSRKKLNVEITRWEELGIHVRGSFLEGALQWEGTSPSKLGRW